MTDTPIVPPDADEAFDHWLRDTLGEADDLAGPEALSQTVLTRLVVATSQTRLHLGAGGLLAGYGTLLSLGLLAGYVALPLLGVSAELIGLISAVGDGLVLTTGGW